MYIEKAAYAFRINGQPISCLNYGHGHINHTYKISTDTGREYILQRINKYVFKDPVKVMNNASAVTNHIRKKVDDPRMVLHFIPTLPTACSAETAPIAPLSTSEITKS